MKHYFLQYGINNIICFKSKAERNYYVDNIRTYAIGAKEARQFPQFKTCIENPGYLIDRRGDFYYVLLDFVVEK